MENMFSLSQQGKTKWDNLKAEPVVHLKHIKTKRSSYSCTFTLFLLAIHIVQNWSAFAGEAYRAYTLLENPKAQVS